MKKKKRQGLRGVLSLCLAAAMLFGAAPHVAAADGWSVLEQQLDAQLAQDNDTNYNGYLVKIKDGISKKRAASLEKKAAEEGVQPLETDGSVYLAETLDDAKALGDSAAIEYIEPNYLMRMTDRVSNPGESDNGRHLALMQVEDAWKYGITGTDIDTDYDMGGDGNPMDQIVVAVIDSGLDPDHEDIDYSHVLAGRDFVYDGENTRDVMGHGTFVTGQIAAVRGNETGIAGIADQVYVMPLRVFIAETTETSIIVNAINYACQQREDFDKTNGKEGANISVINMSLGGEDGTTTMENAVKRAIDAGIIVIVAAGNDGDTRASYPAQYAIGIGSTDRTGTYSYYTQILSKGNGAGYENKVWVSAPGENYTSLWYDGGYYYGSGTSFSAPEVSALAAISVSLQNDLTSCYAGTDSAAAITTNHGAFRQLLKETAQEKHATARSDINGQDIYYGWGIVSFSNMIERLTNLSKNAGQAAQLQISAQNAAGTALTAEQNALTVHLYQDDTEILPQNGSYAVTIGQSYRYELMANKYSKLTGTFTPVRASHKLVLTLDGAEYKTVFQVVDTAGEQVEDARISVTSASGKSLDKQTDGSFLTKNGKYSYTVTADNYFKETGEFTVDDATNDYAEGKNPVQVAMRGMRDVCSVSFNVTATDLTPNATVTVRDTRGKSVTAYKKGVWALDPGEYSYTVTSTLYKSLQGSFTVTEQERGQSKVISAKMTDRLYMVLLDVQPAVLLESGDATITLKNEQGETIAPSKGMPGEYRLTKGYYYYEVAAEGYQTARGAFTIPRTSSYIDIRLQAGAAAPCEHDFTVETLRKATCAAAGLARYTCNLCGLRYQDETKALGHDAVEDAAVKAGCETAGLTAGSHCDRCGKVLQAQETIPATGHSWDDGVVVTPATVRTDGQMRYTCTACGTERMEVIPATDAPSFADVPESAWFYEAVSYVAAQQLMVGMTETTFAPQLTLNRSMMAAIFYRLAGSPKVTGAASFQDVPADDWFTKSVAWAEQNGIIAGYGNGKFGPKDSITREQMASLFYRYAAYQKEDTAVEGSLDGFHDADQISAWAADAVRWAVARGVISGDTSGNFRPAGTATRAEVASVLMRYLRR